MKEFLSMGGYAAYVWSCFGLTFAVLIANAVLARRSHRKILRELETRREGVQ
ncbi:MAG TPA: heme exporter protein CcmD [Gammaproteobacteria bacterium]